MVFFLGKRGPFQIDKICTILLLQKLSMKKADKDIFIIPKLKKYIKF